MRHIFQSVVLYRLHAHPHRVAKEEQEGTFGRRLDVDSGLDRYLYRPIRSPAVFGFSVTPLKLAVGLLILAINIAFSIVRAGNVFPSFAG